VKLHALLNLSGSIPEFIHISDGRLHDVNVLDYLSPDPGAYYIMDRAYMDFERLYEIHTRKAFFVTRAQNNQALARRYSRPVDRATGIICDQTVVLTNFYPKQYYPEPLRRIRFHDPEDADARLVFLTNDFTLSAFSITQLYKARWRIELFFKWIKQHLRIKAFYGTSENAVKTQIWIAVCTYLLIAILKKRLQIELPLYTILQVLSLSLLEKIPINQAFQEWDYTNIDRIHHNQLLLFE
jgi:transposase